MRLNTEASFNIGKCLEDFLMNAIETVSRTSIVALPTCIETTADEVIVEKAFVSLTGSTRTGNGVNSGDRGASGNFIASTQIV